MSFNVQLLPQLYTQFRTRWTERDDRVLIIDRVVSDGNFVALDDNDQELTNRSPNLIKVGIEDTAEAASYVPTVRVTPFDNSDSSKAKAESMERLAASYLDRSKFSLLNIQALMELIGFGYHVWVVTLDNESGGPVIGWRDPRTCYPETGHRPGDPVRTCLFAREVYLRQLPEEHQNKVQREFQSVKPQNGVANPVDTKVLLVEMFTEEEMIVAALYKSGYATYGKASSWTPVELERTATAGGMCPVVIGQRLSLDPEPRGQFDQVVNVLQSHVRLMSLVLDYADQAVYSDVWVKDLIGQMPYGGGSYIQLGPQGAIGRVPPAASSFAVEQQMQQMVDNVHLGGRWPKSRPGEIDQAIASAKFIEATAGMMNTVIRTLHLIMKQTLEQTLRICFAVDKELGRSRTVAGVLANQQFQVQRNREDIDLRAQVRVEYGIGLGRDQSQALVLGIQGMQTGLWSSEFVQENFDGITDVAKERRRIDGEKFRDMAFAMLLQGLQDGSVPKAALIQIAKEREAGKNVFDLFNEYIVKPEQQMMEQQIPSGLGADPMMPGAMAPTPGAAPPAAPDPASLLAALGGGQAPPESIARTSIPMGQGSFAGVQSQAGGA